MTENEDTDTRQTLWCLICLEPYTPVLGMVQDKQDQGWISDTAGRYGICPDHQIWYRGAQ